MVNVDAVGLATRGGRLVRSLRHQLARKNGGCAQRGEPAQESAPRRTAGAGKLGGVRNVVGAVLLRSDCHGPPPLIAMRRNFWIAARVLAKRARYPITLKG